MVRGYTVTPLVIDIVVRADAEWVLDIQGFLGILNILGVEHLMVITARDEVCRVHHKN